MRNSPTRTARQRRPRDEQGSAMLLVITVVLVGFLISSAIAVATMGSVRQTTQGRSNVQAFAAAEAGRDAMIAALSQTMPYCPINSDSVGSATWEATLHYATGTKVPSGTTYDADGTPQHPAGAWKPVTCAGLAAAAPGDYVVVVAATGTAPDGTKRVIDAVYPWHVQPPNDSIMAPVRGPFKLGSSWTGAIGGEAYEGDLVITGEDNVTNFICGDGAGAQPTIIDGDVYVLNGNAEFRKHGCHIKGELYVQGDAKVIGAKDMSLGGELGGSNRHLWVDKDVRVGRDFIQTSGGLTVEGSITAGRDVRLHERDGLLGTTETWNRVRVGTDLTDADVAILAGRDVRLTRVDEAGSLCGVAGAVDVDRGVITGRVQAVGSVNTSEGLNPYDAEYCDLTGTSRENNGGKWRITGNVSAGTTVTLKDTPVGGIRAIGKVTAMNGSTISGDVLTRGAVDLNNSPVTGEVNADGNVTAVDGSHVTGTVTTRGTATFTKSGSGSISANGVVTLSGAGATVTGDVTTPENAIAAVSLASGARVNGTVTSKGGVTVSASTIGGNVLTASTASPAVTLSDGATVSGAVTAKGGVTVNASTVSGSTISGGAVFLTGASSTKAIDAGTTVVASSGSKIFGDVRAGSTNNDYLGVSLDGVTMTGSVKAKSPGVSLTGETTINGNVESMGSVWQTGSRVGGHVIANAAYVGIAGATAASKLAVGRFIYAGQSLTIHNAAVEESVSIGDGSNDPALWAGGRISLLGSKEAMTSTRGTVYGNIRSTTNAPAILVERTWTVTGELQAAGAKTVPADDTSCTGAESICSEGRRTNVPRHLEGGCFRNSSGSFRDWSGDSRLDTPEECNSAPAKAFDPWAKDKNNVGYEYPCGSGLIPDGCIWRGAGWVPTSYYPAASTGASAAPTGTRPSFASFTVSTPDVAAAESLVPLESLPAEPAAPVVPTAPTEDDIRTAGDGVTLLDEGTWMDLSYADLKAAAIQSGYTTIKTYSGSQCKHGWAGAVLTPSPAANEIESLLRQSGQKYIFDTTACADDLELVSDWFSVINSDAVFLVKNYKRWGGSSATSLTTNGTSSNPRRIFVMQPDNEADEQPTCPAGARPLELDAVHGSDRVHTMYYSPCGMTGSGNETSSTWLYGQIVLGANSNWNFVRFRCRPMELGSHPLFRLTCGEPMTASGVAGNGGVKTYSLGALTLQTEPQ